MSKKITKNDIYDAAKATFSRIEDNQEIYQFAANKIKALFAKYIDDSGYGKTDTEKLAPLVSAINDGDLKDRKQLYGRFQIVYQIGNAAASVLAKGGAEGKALKQKLQTQELKVLGTISSKISEPKGFSYPNDALESFADQTGATKIKGKPKPDIKEVERYQGDKGKDSSREGSARL